MEKINAVTFGFMSQRNEWTTAAARESLRLMKENTNASHVILAIVAEQDTPQSTTIHWESDQVLSDSEIITMAQCARDLGLKVILKPIVNVADGTWRAHINFFDHDVPCEPKWSEWFASYTSFISHYAEIAELINADLFVIGCELVNSDRREAEWRQVIQDVRKKFQGKITYNADKYQENYVKWWDAVDVISSSGYYPLDSWETELDRIERVIDDYQKPFFFCEVGCPSREGSQWLPNDWGLQGPVSQEAQANWYQSMFDACKKRKWLDGYGLWDWKATLYPESEAAGNDDYALYGKVVSKKVSDFFK